MYKMFYNGFARKKLFNASQQDLFYLVDNGVNIKIRDDLDEITDFSGRSARITKLDVPIAEVQKYEYYVEKLIWYSNKHYRYNQRTCKWNTKEIPMKYKDLKEFEVENWDGKPFKAIVSDKADDDIGFHEESKLNGSDEPNLVVGFNNGKWSLSPSGSGWTHAYRIEDNKDVYKTHRMTNNQLLQWLSKGKGLLKYKNGVVCTTFSYHESDGENECDEGFTIREWHQTEWVYPSVELLRPILIEKIAINDLNAKLRKKDEDIASLKEKLLHAFDSVERMIGRAYARVHWVEAKTGTRVPTDIGYESLWQSVKHNPPTKEDANDDGMVLFAKREYCDDVRDKMFWDMCNANYDNKFALEEYTHWMYIPVPYTNK